MKNIFKGVAVLLLACTFGACSNCNKAYDEPIRLDDGRQGYRIHGRGKVQVCEEGSRWCKTVKLPYDVIEPRAPWSWECL
jgi:hypothetical protein